jgi:hypothetical protein
MRLRPSPTPLLDDFKINLFVLDTDDSDVNDDVCLRRIDDDDTTNGEEESKGVIRTFVR